jgi:hypothetical protein
MLPTRNFTRTVSPILIGPAKSHGPAQRHAGQEAVLALRLQPVGDRQTEEAVRDERAEVTLVAYASSICTGVWSPVRSA